MMIASFTVSNYRSILNEQCVSFLTTNDKTNRNLVATEVAPNVWINKLAIFFGSNASGKSNILKAIESLRRLMTIPQLDKRSEIPEYFPFELQKDSPTSMGMTFFVEGKKYEYRVLYGRDRIISESLVHYPGRNRASLYTRSYVSPERQPSIDFGSTLKLSKKAKDSIREVTFNNHTVISSLAKLSLKEDALELNDVFTWISKSLHSIDGLENRTPYVTLLDQINKDIDKKAFYLNLLHKADFNITDFRIIEDKSVLQKDVLFNNHSSKGDFEVALTSQSDGTLRFVELLEALYSLVTDDEVYLLDELGNRMHYDLIVYYLTLFLYNSDRSQIFFTTQSILLLDEDFIRRDIIYLTEKNPTEASSSYDRVSDMGLNKHLSIYNAYKIGKLGSKPEIGSPFLSFKL